MHVGRVLKVDASRRSSFTAVTSSSALATPRRIASPRPHAATTSPSTDTDASLTRWTTARIRGILALKEASACR